MTQFISPDPLPGHVPSDCSNGEHHKCKDSSVCGGCLCHLVMPWAGAEKPQDRRTMLRGIIGKRRGRTAAVDAHIVSMAEWRGEVPRPHTHGSYSE